jgi:hypothetical protein
MNNLQGLQRDALPREALQERLDQYAQVSGKQIAVTSSSTTLSLVKEKVPSSVTTSRGKMTTKVSEPAAVERMSKLEKVVYLSHSASPPAATATEVVKEVKVVKEVVPVTKKRRMLSGNVAIFIHIHFSYFIHFWHYY